jgi:hypothetical protein
MVERCRRPCLPLAQIIRGKAKQSLPPVAVYLSAARQRLREIAGLPGDDLTKLQST